MIPRKLCVLRQRILYLVSCRWAIKFCNWENCVFLQGMKNPAMRQLSPEKVAGLLLVYWTAHLLMTRGMMSWARKMMRIAMLQWWGWEAIIWIIKVGYQSRTASVIQSNHGEDDCTCCWTVNNPVKKSLSPPRKREYAKYPPPGCSFADGEFQSRSMIQEVHQCSEQNGMTRLKDNKHLLQRWPSESCTVAFRFLSRCPLIFGLKPA